MPSKSPPSPPSGVVKTNINNASHSRSPPRERRLVAGSRAAVHAMTEMGHGVSKGVVDTYLGVQVEMLHGLNPEPGILVDRVAKRRNDAAAASALKTKQGEADGSTPSGTAAMTCNGPLDNNGLHDSSHSSSSQQESL